MNKVTFEDLPRAVEMLSNEIVSIKQLLECRTEPQAALDQLMTIKQASEFLSLTVATLYGYVQRGAIPVSKRGKRLYFRRSELLAWIQEGRKRTVQESAVLADQYCKTKKG